MSAPLLEVRGLVKEYPGVRALDGVDFTVHPGQVHCLVGQNGAGKSTLIKCIAGLVTPTSGEIVMDGSPLPPGDPAAALARGVATIYQELDLVTDLSVADNLFLGHELLRGPLLDRRAARRQASEVLARLGHRDISPGALAGDLPPATRQVVSIARALTRQARLLIMDEPSAVLGRQEVETLFAVVRRLTAEGVGVVYISHRLDEVAAIGDTITVLRDGQTVAGGLAATTPRAELITAMVGRQFAEVFPDRPDHGPTDGEAPVVLRVEGLRRRPAIGGEAGVSFEVHAGEVLGVGGLVGAGRTKLLRLIAGLDHPDAGSVTVGGRRLPPGRPDLASRAGIGFAPEERKSQGLWPGWDLIRNVSIADLGRFRRRLLLDRRAERAEALQHLRALQTKAAAPDRPVSELSGGNQQKVVLARWLLRHCRVLLLDEPTRGIDVEAKSEIYRIVRTLAGGGIAVVMVSSELAELVALCDRILVLAEGEPTALLPAMSTSEADVLAYALPRSKEGEEQWSSTTDDVTALDADASTSWYANGSAWRRISLQEAALPAVVILLLVAGTITDRNSFLTQDNLLTVLTQASVTGIVAVGMTFVIATGGIDLSVGSMLAAASIAGGLAGDQQSLPFILGAIGFGVLLGTVNGLAISYGRIVPFIATLAMFAGARGLALWMSDKTPISLLQLDFVRDLGRGKLLGIPNAALVFLAVTAAGWVLLNRTRYGRHVIAVGGNREAARMAGIRPSLIVTSVYVLSGFCVGLAAVLLSGRLGSASPVSGNLLKLDAIAAVVIGGTSLAGGRATIIGTFLGVITFGLVFNLLNLLDMPTELQQLTKGVIILGAAALQRRDR